MEMTSDRPTYAEGGALIPAGTVVTYIAHLPGWGGGGAIKVRLASGQEVIVSPLAFPSLR